MPYSLSVCGSQNVLCLSPSFSLSLSLILSLSLSRMPLMGPEASKARPSPPRDDVCIIGTQSPTPSRQAVGNTVKRVVILVATSIAFATPMTSTGNV